MDLSTVAPYLVRRGKRIRLSIRRSDGFSNAADGEAAQQASVVL